MKLLFKALTKTGKDEFKWVQGLPTFDCNLTGKITGLDTGKEYFPILAETLCQATGKLDKNGKDVFEKDRLKFVHKVGDKTFEEVLTIYFNESTSQFMVGKADYLLPLSMYKPEEAEVVGNEINDNFIKPKKGKKK